MGSWWWMISGRVDTGRSTGISKERRNAPKAVAAKGCGVWRSIVWARDQEVVPTFSSKLHTVRPHL